MEKRGKKCSRLSKCNNIRECDYCAKARQQQIAGVAEAIEQQYGQLTMTVIKPRDNTSAAIKAVHASFMRRALAPVGIWTVETGELFSGLHLNIISPKPLEVRWKGCETYSEVLRTAARDAAAYISKRSGMPQQEQYAGRLYGAFGKIGEILATQERVPVVQAAALEVVLSGQRKGADVKEEKIFKREQDWARVDTSKPTFYNPAYPNDCNPPLVLDSGSRGESTKEQRAEIMRKHLPNLYAAQGREYK